jgi:hypothetical protein
MARTRSIIGLVARGLFWLCALVIAANAVTQSISTKDYALAVLEVVGFPATYVLYPFLQPSSGHAWPWDAGHTLIPVLIVGVIAYPVSTVIGGLRAIKR